MAEPFDALTTAERLAAGSPVGNRDPQSGGSRASAGSRACHRSGRRVGRDQRRYRLGDVVADLEERGRPTYSRGTGPGTAPGVDGEVLEPDVAMYGRRAERGQIGGEHVTIIRGFFKRLPSFVDPETRDAGGGAAGRDRVRAQARGVTAGGRPVGDVARPGRRTDRRGSRAPAVSDNRQAAVRWDERGTRATRPEGRAAMDAVLAKLAAPGMCNPDDESPCLDGDPSTEAEHPIPSQGQRNHDALTAMGRTLLASAHSAATTACRDDGHLHHAARPGISKGHAVTGGGSLLADVGGDPQAAAPTIT